MRNIACEDCVVTALLGPIPIAVSEHTETFQVLADAGLVAPLRLVTKNDESPAGAHKDVDDNQPNVAAG